MQFLLKSDEMLINFSKNLAKCCKSRNDIELRQASPATADAFCAFCAMMWSSCADSDAIAAWRGRATACWGGGLTLGDDAVAAKAAKMSP